jgi:hypothetical protein
VRRYGGEQGSSGGRSSLSDCSVHFLNGNRLFRLAKHAILVDPTPETTLFDIGAIRYELRTLLGVRVDVLTPKALPESFRALVISEAVPV